MNDATELEYQIQCEILDFCMCGQPETVFNYLLIILRSFKKIDDTPLEEEWGKTPPGWEKALAERDKLFNSKGEQYFVYYWLTKEDFTEHGGSVPGWLTGKGENLLELLEKWKIEN
jgi:hypothetical protein